MSGPFFSLFFFFLFFSSPRLQPAREISLRAVYSESDPGSTRMTSLPFPEGLRRFASLSPPLLPQRDPLFSSSSLIRALPLHEGRKRFRIVRKSRVGYREFSAISRTAHLAGMKDTFGMSVFREPLCSNVEAKG